jgi:hypothetical protein
MKGALGHEGGESASKRGIDPLLKIVLLSSAGNVLEWMDFR